MSDSKTQKPSSPDSLAKSGKGASIELSESELSKVAGGRVKTSDKQQEAVLGFIKG